MSLHKFALTSESLLTSLVDKYSRGDDISEDIQDAIKLLDEKNSMHSDLLRPNQVAAYLNMHRVTLHRISERDSNFPRKIKAGERLCYYRKSELDSWLKSREV